MKREKAVAVGNRAGIVEWANSAWSRVTGYALEDAIAKPVGDVLASAGIDGDVIDFVRQRFERGEPCEIELPLAPPGAAPRWIHVSVESLRDRHGEVSHFAAIAWDVTAEKAAAERGPSAVAAHAPAAAERNAAPPRRPDPALRLRATDLSNLAREVAERHAGRGPARTDFDLALPEGLPWVGVDRERAARVLDGLVADAAGAIGDEWGTVSLSTGVARAERLFVSPTYPRNCLLRGLPEGFYVYVEVHDTAAPLDPTTVAAIAGAEPADGAPQGEGHGRAARIARARATLRAHGGELRLDADPGFGTRVILLFPC